MSNNYTATAPKFRSRKNFIQLVADSYVSELEDMIPLNLKEINDFKVENNDLFKYFGRACGALSFISLRAFIRLTAKSFQEKKLNLQEFRQLKYKYLLTMQWEFYIAERRRVEYLQLEEPREVNRITVPEVLGNNICDAAIIGHRGLFESTVKYSLDLFDKELVGSNHVSLTQFFVLQLAENFLGLEPRNWLNDTKKLVNGKIVKTSWAIDIGRAEPLFADLNHHWNDKNTDILEPLLIQLLNRHTFQATKNNKDGAKDYGGLHVEQYPLEVFFILRLREWQGLSIPELNHPLMEPPFDRLPEAAVELAHDEEIIQLMKKVRASFSDYEELINKTKIRDWDILF